MEQAISGAAPRSFRWPTILVSTVGLALSLGLEFIHYRAYLKPTASSFCAVGQRLDCASVAVSPYSVVLGVPLPFWGVAGFLAMLIAAWKRSRWLLPLAGVGLLSSLALLAIELLQIHALCMFCEGVHVAALVVFWLAWRDRKALLEPLTEVDSALLIFGPPLGLILALMLFLPPYWGVYSWRGEVPFAHGKTNDGYPWIGAQDPKLTVHEYTDYSCPHCKAVTAYTLRKLAAHPKKLRLVRQQNPRMGCSKTAADSCKFVRLAYCAEEQGKFWQADRWLFAYASEHNEPDLSRMARELEIDESKLRTCFTRDDIYVRADNESRLARKKLIPGAPYYIVGDKRLPPEKLESVLSGL